MTKRILAFVLVLVLTMSLLPLSLVAAETADAEVKASPKAGTHSAAAHADDCGITEGWLPWESDNSLPTSGNYYLTKNVKLTAEYTLSKELNLCLNGYVIEQTADVRVMSFTSMSGAKLTVCDCTAYEEDDTYYAGAITGGNDVTATGGGAAFVRRGTELVVYDGRFVGNSTKTAGGAILTQAKSGSNAAGALTIYGGEFAGNVVVGDVVTKNGGAVYISNGTSTTVHGGIFRNNTAYNGGAINAASGSTLVIKDGLFENNAATGANGGAIYLMPSSTTSNTTSAKVTIEGGTFTGNTAKTNGGALDTTNGGTLTVTGGTFTGNTAAYGGAFHLRANTVNITNATMEGNTATGGGSAIYVYSSVKLTLGDGTVITGNNCTRKDDVEGYGGAVCIGASSKDVRVWLTGKVYIAGNEMVAENFGDLNFRRADDDIVRVNGLAEGSYVEFSAPKAENVTDPDDAANPVIMVDGTQESWSSGWVAFKDASGVRHIGYADGNFSFVEGHFHENVEYKPLTSADQLIAGGAYYLTDDTTLNKAVNLTGTTETSICLNGKTLKSTVTTAAPFSTASKTDAATFNIDDCTAYTDADGVYHAGAIDGMKNNSTGHGGIFMIRDKGTLNIANGKFINNTVKNVGGVAHVNGTVNVTGGLFENNECQSYVKNGSTVRTNGGVFYVNSQGKLYIENAVFSKNTANQYGGAIYSNGILEVKNSRFTENKAASSGAICLGGKLSALIDGCTFTGNTAKSAAAMNVMSSTVAVTIKDSTFTGNSSTDGYGAVNVIKGVKPVILKGKVVITDNTHGEVIKNFHVQKTNETDAFDATGLTEGSKIGITLENGRTVRTFSTASASNNKSYFFSDNTDYQVDLNEDNKLYLKEAAAEPPVSTVHKHTQCCDTGCTEHTAEVTYEAWTDATSLPSEGNWYLDTDVTVSAEVNITTATTLNLCLNGHTVKGFTAAGARAYSTTSGTATQINISDCTAKTVDGVYTAGKFTGFNNTHTNSGGSAIYIRAGSHLNFFDGIVENCNAASGGGIYIHTATANIYNGLITNNTALNGTTWKPGAGLFMFKSTVNVANAQFTGNKGSYGAAINLADGTCVLNLTDVTVTGNVAYNAGAINGAYTASKVTVSGNTVVYGNTLSDGTASNMRLGNTGSIIVKDLSSTAKIGVNLGGNRAFSNVIASDLSAQFPNDDSAYTTYLDADSKLAQRSAFEHVHCVCGKADCTDASHEKISYAAWTDATSLPSSGSYCLQTDVTVTAEASVSGTLNLCLHGHKVTGKGGRGVRFFSTPGKGGEVLNITDCTAKTEDGVYTAGGFFDNNNTHDNSGGGAIYIRKNGTLNFYEGIVSGNTSATGGAAFYGKNATLNIYNGLFTSNKAYNSTTDVWRNGAVIYSDSSNVTVYGGTFSGNEAKVGAVCHADGTGTLNILGGTFTGNIAHESAGGFNAAATTVKVKLGGDVTIFGNTAAGKASNLRLAGNKADVTDLAETAKIGVTGNAFSYFTTETPDYTKQFESDDTRMEVIYQNGAMYLNVNSSEHMHCLCAGTSTVGCDHAKTPFLPWESADTLPTGGNYYLTTDVTISTQCRLEDTELNLCLNGYTIKVTKGRAFYMTDGATLTLTDCQGTGKITGATLGAILTNSAGEDMTLNLFGGQIVDNHTNGTGAALVMQGNVTFNMYGGKVCGNSATSTLSYDADGNVKLDADGNQVATGVNAGAVYVGGSKAVFNMYGGEISGNKVTHVEYLKAGATSATKTGGYGGGLYVNGADANLYGGVICGNEALLGGGVFISGSGAELNLLGTEVSGNKASSGAGVISQTHAVINLKAGAVKNNTSTNDGAGVYVSTGTTLNMTGGEISGNVGINGTTYKAGAGIRLLASTANISGGVIKNNKGSTGAAIYMNLSGTRYPTLNLSGDVLITGNESTGNGTIFVTGEGAKITMTGGTITGNKAANGGGIITQTKSSLELSGGKITNNTTTSSGAGLYISTNTTFKMTGGTISGNVAKGAGGGITILRAKATITGGSISGNTAANGAGMKINGATVTIGGVSVTGNHAIGTLNKKTGKYTGANGGGIYIGRAGYKKNGVQMYDYPVISVYGPYVANNKADGSAGGMIVESNGTKFNMYSGTFAYNKAPNGNGGGIYFSNYSNPNIYGGKIYGNEAKSAAAIYSANNTGVMENLKIYDNVTSGSSTVIITGAASLFTAKNLEIYDNVTGAAGGGITIQGSAVYNLEDSKIYGNTAKTVGGGVYFSTPGFGTWKNVEIYENVAASSTAGGIHVGQSSIVNFENVTIRDNSAGAYGGGIVNRGRLNMENCKILNNTAATNGGGIGTFTSSHVNMGQDAGTYVNNTVISGNRAGEQGGGVYGHRGGPVYLHSCTITDNTATLEGGGVYANGRFGLVNATVTGNLSGGEGFAVYFTAGEFDGHSYSTGHKKVGGNMIVKDNQGGDFYMGEGSAVAVVEGPLGEKTHMEITLHSGVLSEHLFGEYDYEGGDLIYTVTAGSRSLTDPEKYEYYQAPVEDTENTQQTTQEKNSGDIWLYVGIGIVALIVIAVVVLVVKKKAGKSAEKANKE